MLPAFIVVQAGGKGTRLGYLTANKPKALVPVDNLPMLFHLFRKYPNSQYIIIGDHKYDVLKRYLAAFAEVKYQLVCATGQTGTCAGLRQAVGLLPKNEPFMLIWSDLILPRDFDLPDKQGNYIGVAKDFPCRWKYENGTFAEERSDNFGVAGLFAFTDKSVLKNVPDEGELVRWLATSGQTYQSLPLYRVKEYGLFLSMKSWGLPAADRSTEPILRMGILSKSRSMRRGRALPGGKQHGTSGSKGSIILPAFRRSSPMSR